MKLVGAGSGFRIPIPCDLEIVWVNLGQDLMDEKRLIGEDDSGIRGMRPTLIGCSTFRVWHWPFVELNAWLFYVAFHQSLTLQICWEWTQYANTVCKNRGEGLWSVSEKTVPAIDLVYSHVARSWTEVKALLSLSEKTFPAIDLVCSQMDRSHRGAPIQRHASWREWSLNCVFHLLPRDGSLAITRNLFCMGIGLSE